MIFSRLAAIAAVLSVMSESSQMTAYARSNKVMHWEVTELLGLVKSVRQSHSRSNRGRIGGSAKKRKAKWFARSHGKRLSSR